MNCKTSKTKINRIGLLFLLLFVNVLTVFSQLERFKNYDVAEGICHSFIYTINQDKNGFIWIGTGAGLCRFDGYEFNSFSDADSLGNDVANVSFKDSFGDLWFGYSNGLVLNWDGNAFKKYVLPGKNVSGITSISQTPWGEIFITTLNKGCFFIPSKGEPRSAGEDFNGKLISTAFFYEDHLFLGTSEGLEIIPIEEDSFVFNKAVSPEQLAYINIQTIEKTPWNSFVVGTEDSGVFLLKDSNGTYEVKPIAPNSLLANQNVQDLLLTPDNNLWVCTYYGGLIKLSEFQEDGSYKYISNYKKGKGFNTNYFKSLFYDREENLWVGTYGAGISLLAEQSFSFLNFDKYLADNNITAVATNDSMVWVGGENHVLQFNVNYPDAVKDYSLKDGLPKDKITTLGIISESLYVGTESSGIYRKDPKRNKFKRIFDAGNSLGNSINNLLVDNKTLYAATKNGIYILDFELDRQYHYNTEAGLPHNDIEQLFIDSDNHLVFATRSNGIFEVDPRGNVLEYFTVGNYELSFNSITQDLNHHVWVSTFGQGVFLLMPDTVINFTANEGLKSNYCYSISGNDSNYVWIGHRLGLSRININDLTVKVFDVDYGISGDVNQNAVSTKQKDKIFFGTTDGLIIYDGSKAKDTIVPPKTNLLNLYISDELVDHNKDIVLPFDPYKLRIEFVGLSYSDPEAVKYQYKLEGYDPDWSDVTDQRYAVYSRVEDGVYEFKVRSFTQDGKYEEEPVGFSIRIKPPIWKRWWFITLMVLLGLAIIVSIIKYRERKQKEFQEYLEQKLDERTREVVEQKEEIEIKNRDITDSINYAQRIQTSILPPIKKLQLSFSGSFIFYQPRDIVSGDFYWFDKVSDDRFVIVCADSTGHGVPGAFMSMIGTTLIKDICISQKAQSPGEILTMLDEQLSNILNQNDNAQSNDGMDIMVIEIDNNTMELRYASAMRPMILYKNGEQLYIKGSRSSIGGQYDKESKDFIDKTIQLNKGDLIYMFSDGYPDQFGGPLGKKFKMVRLKNLLKDIHKKPMEEQYEYVKSTFNLWREEYDQVDDVLFMGIKL